MTTHAQLQSWDDIQTKLGDRQRMVLEIISVVKGATIREIADTLRLDMSAVSGRVTELCDRGLVIDSGLQRLNPRSGKMNTVWIAAGHNQPGLL